MHELELPALHLINYSDPVSGGSDSSPPVRLTECLPLLSSQAVFLSQIHQPTCCGAA